ncbi:hypothetical protein D770_05470 [Flammeovirgaceae bacterium 311]|nr:hypothetical protein D770_05470 [Flammeovirgaceae bacterium 311]
MVITFSALAIVKYPEGSRTVAGVQLLQDRDNPLTYYYIPQFPRLATKPDGTFEFMCIKYVGKGGEESNGGLFHALVEFILPASMVDSIQGLLQKEVPGALIAGPVPLQHDVDGKQEGSVSFKVISSIFNNSDGKNPFSSQVLTSGFAPLTPGSKSAIAARLNQAGATLLWESMNGSTSDVSVALQGYYVAAVSAYNAVVTAEMETVYEHFSRLYNDQEGFTKTQLRKVSDELVQNQVLKIDVYDPSAGMGVDAKSMEKILDLVTDKLIELMFDAQAGWAKAPDREVAVENDQIKGRQERGWFSTVFGGTEDVPYYTDHQFVIKDRKDVRTNTFYLNLSKATSMKVPVYTSGNLGGLYKALGNNEKYFRIVSLDDPDFQQREVHFQVDGKYAQSFGQILNFVSVSFRKKYGNSQSDITNDIHFDAKDLAEGISLKSIKYPRLGAGNSDWLDYEYQIRWSFKGNQQIVSQPAAADGWTKNKSPVVSLIPPFVKRDLEIDADRKSMLDSGIHSAVVKLYVVLSGKPQVQKTITLRNNDPENSNKLSVYHDKGEPIAYQLVWYSPGGKWVTPLTELKEDYFFLSPPDKTVFAKD